jgi:hypothetical protein
MGSSGDTIKELTFDLRLADPDFSRIIRKNLKNPGPLQKY